MAVSEYIDAGNRRVLEWRCDGFICKLFGPEIIAVDKSLKRRLHKSGGEWSACRVYVEQYAARQWKTYNTTSVCVCAQKYTEHFLNYKKRDKP